MEFEKTLGGGRSPVKLFTGRGARAATLVSGKSFFGGPFDYETPCNGVVKTHSPLCSQSVEDMNAIVSMCGHINEKGV